MAARTPRTSGYDAFISYSHAVSGKLAATLQSWLERFATPWYRPRSLRIFRDTTSLSANEDLWQTIADAMAASKWFILLASPEAAQSKWVNREVQWWRANKPAGRVCIVLTAGELAWDEAADDWDWKRTTTLPPSARGMFEREPLWVDLSSVQTPAELDRSNPVLLGSVAQIAAPLRGTDKDLLVGEHITQLRRARRQRRSGVTGLAVLLVAAVVAAVIAVQQRDQARTQARIATARQLAATAVSDLNTHLDLAQLLAVAGYRMDPSPQTRAALFQAVTASPSLVRYLPVGGPVSALAGSADGRTAVAGTRTGRLIRWNVARGTASRLMVGSKPILDLAVTADGGTVVATDGATTVLWDANSDGRPRRISTTAQLVAISPSGRWLAALAFAGGQRYSPQPPTLTLLDGRTGRQSRRATEGADRIGFPDDSTLMLTSSIGTWQALSVPTLQELGRSGDAVTPAGDFVSGYSPDGRYMAYLKYGGVTAQTNGGPAHQNPSDAAAPFGADVPVPEPDLLTINGNGTYVAVAGGGAFYVASLQSSQVGAPTRLSGGGRVEAAAFLGNGRRLVSAADGSLALWDPDQPSRLSHRPSFDVPNTITAGTPPEVAVTPDGQRIAVVSGPGGDDIAVHDLSSPSPQSIRLKSFEGSGLPLWSADGSRLLLVSAGGATQILVGRRTDGSWPAEGSNPILAGRLSPDGKEIVLVDDHGGVQIRRTSDGKLQRNLPAGAEQLAPPGPLQAGVAAISADTQIVAFVRAGQALAGGPVIVIDTRTGRSHELPGGHGELVAFGDDQLLVQRDDGALDIWNASGTAKLHSFAGDAGYARALVAIPHTSLAVRLRADGTALVVELGSGALLGSIQLPTPTQATTASPWHATTMAASGASAELVTASAGGQARHLATGYRFAAAHRLHHRRA